jgi:CRISPR-associated protein (TIGR03986 family)
MSNIKTPYNFVPIAASVVKPYWANYISHDIPFEDHQSGEIEVTLEAKSPIFVKNGIGQEDDKSYYNNGAQIKPHKFNQFQNKYFIPGSSIKGMVRSVLEIMSFGRMENKVNDTRYSVRDFQNNDIYPKTKISNNILCGWLKEENGEYVLKECGKPVRISHAKIDEEFGSNMAAFFSNKDNIKPDVKSAHFKYKKFDSVSNTGNFNTYKTQYGDRGEYDANGKEGTLVFTGQPGHRFERNGKWQGKFYEFIFFDNNNESKPISEDIIKNFFFAYYNHDVTNQKDDWKWRKPQLDSGQAIPVFFRKENGNIKDMGLSMLYKITYDYSVKESIQNHQKETDYDLSEAMFGFVEEKTKQALKGRVHFGHAFAEHAEKMAEQKEVLAGPKASYYPTYIRQDIKNGRVRNYKTFMDQDAVIAGWKRYPVTNAIKHNPPPIIKGRTNDKIATKFIPLKEGATFKFKVRYHNLKKIELGALLSALTFHQTEGTFHSLGMAKPLGYGKIKLSIGEIAESKVEEYLCAFESYMNIELRNDLPEWRASEQITELIMMVSEQESNHNDSNPYLEDPKKFADAKKAKQALDLYSKQVNNTKELNTFCSPDDINTMISTMNKEKEEFLNLRKVDEIINDNIKNKKEIVAELFEEKKRQLLKALANKHQEIKELEEQQAAEKEAKEREQRKAERQIASQANGIDLDGINEKDKKAFDSLRKEVESFSRKYHNVNDKQLGTEFPNGFLPESAYDAVENKIQEIFSHLNKKVRQKWLKLNSSQFKKVVEWMGKEKAENLFKHLSE